VRIAHVTATFPPQYTGTGMVCYHNALGLARLGHDVTVYTAAAGGGEAFDPPGVTVRRLPPLLRLGNAPLLPGLLRLSGFDLVHLHYPFIFGAELVWAVSHLRDTPYVLTYHNDLIGQGVRRYLFAGYLAVSSPVVLRGARMLAVVSADHAASCLVRETLQGRWKDVVVIPNGVDIELFHPERVDPHLRERQSVPGDALIVLFVGALDQAHHYRRPDLLLEAVRRLRDPRVHLLIVGDGDRMPYYRSYAAQCELDSRVRFLGTLDQSELVKVYATADVLVLPSQIQESFGLVLLEAWASGKPVIASNLPGVRSVVSHGEDGLLVRPGDAGDLAAKMSLLLDDPSLRQHMGQRGRRKVEAKYSWSRIIPRLVELYQLALAPEAAGA
jgi:glycosyltransferase involved in cell wall biosynthesis